MDDLKTELVITEYEHSVNRKKYRMTGLFRGRKLLEARFEKSGETPLLGNIYIGRVKNVAKNLNAAFIEYQPETNGYFPLDRCRNPIYVRKQNPEKPDPEQGDELLVQVSKENVKSKLPTLSSDLNLTGSYCALTSAGRKIGVSRKIGKEKRKELLALFEDEEFEDFGLVLRTNAQNAEPEEIQAEYRRLRDEFERIRSGAPYRTCFSCLRESEPEYIRALRNVRYEELAGIVTDQPDLYEKICSVRENVSALADVPVTLYSDPMYPLSSSYNIGKQIERALAKRVWLPSGGYLVIEPTEALTVIDVNSGKSEVKKKPEPHFLGINKEAAKEIAVQLRLRNISGIVIIDFIDLTEPSDREELLKCLSDAVRDDHTPVQVVDYTRLDLVELTRKKVSKSLAEQLT